MAILGFKEDKSEEIISEVLSTYTVTDSRGERFQDVLINLFTGVDITKSNGYEYIITIEGEDVVAEIYRESSCSFTNDDYYLSFHGLFGNVDYVYIHNFAIAIYNSEIYIHYSTQHRLKPTGVDSIMNYNQLVARGNILYLERIKTR